MINDQNYYYCHQYLLTKFMPFNTVLSREFNSCNDHEALQKFLDTHVDEKTKNRLSSALRKKSSRQNKPTKTKSFELSPDSEFKLRIMANGNEMEKSEFLTWLINTEYQKFRKSRPKFGFLTEQHSE